MCNECGGDLRARYSIGVFAIDKKDGKMLAMELSQLIGAGVLQRVEDDKHLKLLFDNKTEIIWDASLENMCAQLYDFIFVDYEIDFKTYVNIVENLLKPSRRKKYCAHIFWMPENWAAGAEEKE